MAITMRNSSTLHSTNKGRYKRSSKKITGVLVDTTLTPFSILGAVLGISKGKRRRRRK